MFHFIPRLFSQAPKKVPKLNQPDPSPIIKSGFKFFFGTTFTMLFLKIVVPEFRARKTMENLFGYEPIPSPKPAHVLLRRQTNQDLSSKMIQKPLIIHSKGKSGLTSALKGFCSEQSHCLMLETRGKWSENLNQVGIPVTFSFYDYRLFTLIIAKLIQKYPDLVFILDGFENLSANERKYLARLVRTKSINGKGNFVIAGQDLISLRQFHQAVDCDCLHLQDLTREEFHNVLKGIEGYRFEDVDFVYEECGSELEYVLEAFAKGIKVGEFLDLKKKEIEISVDELMKGRETRESFVAILASCNYLRPLGNIYYDSKVVGELIKKELVQGYDIDSFCFKNKFVLKCCVARVQEIIKSGQSKSP